jgi:outer membrane protein assembly factor BamA
LAIDRLFPQVRLSMFSSTLVRDTRDDQLNPTSGTLISLDGELAMRAIGSEVGFTKAFGQVFWFYRIPAPKTVVLALGVRVGLATGFPQLVPSRDAMPPCSSRANSPPSASPRYRV